jgi:ribulose-phosphate 3-epimerase
MRPQLKIASSILAADFARLGDEIRAAEAGGATQIHVDVMDGHFVPNITMGPVVVRSIRPVTGLPLDVHLMISEPDRYLEVFAEAGANALTAHVEVCPDMRDTVRRIKTLGARAGVAISPPTPISALEPVISEVDIVLVMTVNPGFGGQAFMEESLPRIEGVRAMLDARNPGADLAVDGGIGPKTAGRVVAAGANVLVAGHAIFRAEESVKEAIEHIRGGVAAP